MLDSARLKSQLQGVCGRSKRKRQIYLCYIGTAQKKLWFIVETLYENKQRKSDKKGSR
jgi:hypothetical protein